MPLPPDWIAASAVATCDVIPWKGSVWRGHSPRWFARDAAGSRRRSGRFHRALDEFPAQDCWLALYTALDRATAMGEVRRNAEEARFNHYRYTELWVQLESVLDCRDLSRLGLAHEQFLDDDYDLGQAPAAAALALDVEGAAGAVGDPPRRQPDHLP